MKRTLGQVLRTARKPALGLCAAGTLVVAGCSKSESDPAAVTVDKLKYPGNLTVSDLGNGKFSLAWTASNNEDDFGGFNVYGMKDDSKGTLSADEGTALELLDDAGEPVTTARQKLALYNFSPTSKLESAGAALADTTSSSSDTKKEEPQFSALPIYGLASDGTTKLTPTCKVDGHKCVATTTENQDKTVKDHGGYAGNGRITFDPSQFGLTLTVGSKYCFLVLSTMDSGKKVSQTSSNVECLTPKYAVSNGTKSTFTFASASDTNDKANFLKWDLNGWLATCTASGCSDPGAGTTKYLQVTGVNASHTPDDTDPVYIESFNGGVQFVAGKGGGVTDLGYYTQGFNDPTLPPEAPKFTLGTDTTANNAPVLNGGGYSSAGQSVPLAKNHIYVIATPGKAANTTHYYWVYITSVVAPDSDIEIEVRTGKADDER